MGEVRRVSFFLLCFSCENGEGLQEWGKFVGFGSFFFVSRVKMVGGENGGSSSGLVLPSVFFA